MVPLKYLSNFWRILEMPFINCEINLILIYSPNCFIMASPIDIQVPKFVITDTKLYVPPITLSTQDSAKLLDQLDSSLKRTVNWNKSKSKATIQTLKQYFDYLIDPSY